MRRFLEHRIADKRVLRLIDKWLAAGVIEDGKWSETVAGHRRVAYAKLNITNPGVFRSWNP